ncbi:MAG: amidase [Chromatiales bacterium]|nr:amidase [Chromatiales bacterium]
MSDSTITHDTIAAAERLAGVEYTEAERTQVLATVAPLLDRARTYRAKPLPNALVPACSFDPRLPGVRLHRPTGVVRFRPSDPGPLPADDAAIAFAPLTALSAWLGRGEITSTRLTEIYLERLTRLGPGLECVVTRTEALARAQAARADAELAAGRRRSPLHGVPWGAKDLLDTAGIRTTWGATPFKDRVPDRDAWVVRRLADAGAVLVAKTTMGALAYGDVWFGGRTRNPWNTEEGSSGSSAGSASATAAGLVGFSIGTETMGSIVSPSMRCGTAGLRPSFGRVPRNGAMALGWSLDKIGPICRSAEDTALVLATLNGHDPGDPGSLDVPLEIDTRRDARGIRVGYDPRWLDEEGVEALDRAALDFARTEGMEVREIQWPDLPWDALWTPLSVESAAAFEALTLSGDDDQLVRQDDEAWPNRFRRARFLTAIDYIQGERVRRLAMQALHAIFEEVDVLLGPSFASTIQLATNMTGHPSLTVRAGFVHTPTRVAITAIGARPTAVDPDAPRHRVPYGVTLWGRLFDEGTLLRAGIALERAFGATGERPAGYD